MRLRRPSLVITAVRMPKMDALELIKRIRADVTLTHTPILVLTALAFANDRAQACRAGAHAYISKPTRLLVVRKQVRELLAVRASGTQPLAR
ncbi:MAG: response regulator [Chloroflexaceae bacterium]|nr:response regulator [Chloroflexaceae bacterium]